MLLIIWICLYTKGKISMRMASFLSPFIKKRQTNSCTSLTVPFIKDIQSRTWGELKRYVRYNTEEKNFKKLRVRFFLRLRTRGFRKYTLTKLFSKVTYSQRNGLLKKRHSSLQRNHFYYFTGSREETAPRWREDSQSFAGRGRGCGHTRPHGPSCPKQHQHYKQKHGKH